MRLEKRLNAKYLHIRNHPCLIRILLHKNSDNLLVYFHKSGCSDGEDYLDHIR